jgi:hypothetical protein
MQHVADSITGGISASVQPSNHPEMFEMQTAVVGSAGFQALCATQKDTGRFTRTFKPFDLLEEACWRAVLQRTNCQPASLIPPQPGSADESMLQEPGVLCASEKHCQWAMGHA